MKKIVFLLSAMLVTMMGYAQDYIVKKDGSDIKSKVLEVSDREVKYKAWDNMDGPVFILSSSEILMIRFENGTNHVMKNVLVAKEKPKNLDGPFFTSDINILESQNLKYKEIKSFYDKKDYASLDNPYYGLGWPWLNLVVPGLSQFIMKEPKLGTTYLLLSLGSDVLMTGGYIWGIYSLHDPTSLTFARICFVTGAAGAITVMVLSICNAYDIAKIKSLYQHDLNIYNQGYSFRLEPTLNYTMTPSGCRLAPGVGLKVSF